VREVNFRHELVFVLIVVFQSAYILFHTIKIGVDAMKAGVLRYNLKSENISDFKHAMDEFLSELHKEIKGFQAGFLFISPKTGKSFSVGIYDTEEDAEALMSSASYTKFLSKIRNYVTAEPTRDVCEVSGDLKRVTGRKKAA
jgi:hypothetical protein